MRIGERCVCHTCVQHRAFYTQETEPTNVIGSSVTSSVPASSGPAQALGSTSDQSSRTETPPPPPVTTTVNPEPPAQSVDDDDASSKSSPVQTSSSPPTTFSFPPPVSSQLAQALGPNGSLPGPSPLTPAPGPSSSKQASLTNLVGSRPPLSSCCSTASTPSTFASLVTPSQLQLKGSVVQASAPPNNFNTAASAFPPPFSGPTQDFANAGVFAASRTAAPKNPFPGFSVDYLPGCTTSNRFGPNPQTTTTPVSGRSSPFVAGGGGSRYPPYAPTPDLENSGGQGMMMMSISASNSHGHKSHEELRWEDYKNGDKGGAPAHKPRNESRWDQDYKNGDKGRVGWFPPPDHTSRPDRPQMRTIDLTYRDVNGFPIGYNTPAAFQRPHEPAGVSSPASGCCTACGATSSSSPSSHSGFNVATSPPSAATSLPGLFFPTYGSVPLLFAAPNLAAHGTTATPGVQGYAIMFGTPNFTSQGTTATPAFQAYPMMFGTPNLVGQGTTTAPAVQPFPMMFGTTNLGAQGTRTTPAAQPYPTMFGTQSLAAQVTTTSPAAQHYPTMFGTPSLAAQGTTTTPAAQPYPTMFGTSNLGAQGITPAANGLIRLPFSAMSLQ